jgi:hypothetical protein
MSPNLTSAERMDVYRRIFLIKRSFHLIVQQVKELGKIHMLNNLDLRDMLGLTQEVQLEINTALLSQLDSVENDDCAQFGKVRTAMEKRLRGPAPKRTTR